MNLEELVNCLEKVRNVASWMTELIYREEKKKNRTTELLTKTINRSVFFYIKHFSLFFLKY